MFTDIVHQVKWEPEGESASLVFTPSPTDDENPADKKEDTPEPEFIKNRAEPNRYKILLNKQLVKSLKDYLEKLKREEIVPGLNISKAILRVGFNKVQIELNPTAEQNEKFINFIHTLSRADKGELIKEVYKIAEHMTLDDLLNCLLKSKDIQISAEAHKYTLKDERREWNKWNNEEVKLLSEIVIAADVEMYDKGFRGKGIMHEEPLHGSAYFISSPMLNVQISPYHPDYNEVMDLPKTSDNYLDIKTEDYKTNKYNIQKLNKEKYKAVIERRLIPILYDINQKSQKSKALVYMPALGCGQFRGELDEVGLKSILNDTLQSILQEHGSKLPNIGVVLLDNHKDGITTTQKFEGIHYVSYNGEEFPELGTLNTIESYKDILPNNEDFINAINTCKGEPNKGVYRIFAGDALAIPPNEFNIGFTKKTDEPVAGTTNLPYVLYNVKESCYPPYHLRNSDFNKGKNQFYFVPHYDTPFKTWKEFIENTQKKYGGILDVSGYDNSRLEFNPALKADLNVFVINEKGESFALSEFIKQEALEGESSSLDENTAALKDIFRSLLDAHAKLETTKEAETLNELEEQLNKKAAEQEKKNEERAFNMEADWDDPNFKIPTIQDDFESLIINSDHFLDYEANSFDLQIINPEEIGNEVNSFDFQSSDYTLGLPQSGTGPSEKSKEVGSDRGSESPVEPPNEVISLEGESPQVFPSEEQFKDKTPGLASTEELIRQGEKILAEQREKHTKKFQAQAETLRRKQDKDKQTNNAGDGRKSFLNSTTLSLMGIGGCLFCLYKYQQTKQLPVKGLVGSILCLLLAAYNHISSGKGRS